MSLGEKIIYLRKEKKMSQESLAEILNVSRQTIYKWECNLSWPSKTNLDKLVKIFEVSYDFLLSDDIECWY